MVCSYKSAVRLLLLLLGYCVVLQAVEKPNILWITAEDMSPTLGCYGDTFATTPNIDKLAKEGVLYSNAFANAPVCSPSRSCLITGCYPTSLSTQQMRSGFSIPKHMRGFPALLRDQGYFTTNNVKTDYNTANYKEIIEASWSENSNSAHWRNRTESSQPFFSIFNLMTSHQSRSMVWPYKQFKKEIQSQILAEDIHAPADVPLPPYYPDTPLIRREMARYYDCVTAMDIQVGIILKQLKNDNLKDNTIIFFFSDHGSGMPRHKRALLDSGMHVPLIIYFPKKWQHLSPYKPGSTTDSLVSFVDFASTILNLTGVINPISMQGKPFLGPNVTTKRSYVYGHRDRVDEVRDLARSVRDSRYLYIRNYMPHLGYNQPTAWPDKGEIRHEFYRLAKEKKMTPEQWHFAGPYRPVEELYDCLNDPRNLKNLAKSKKHKNILGRLRSEHIQHITDTVDLGFLPESEAWTMFGKRSGWELGQSKSIPFNEIRNAAVQVGIASESEFLKNLESENSVVRYWGAIGLTAKKTISNKAKGILKTKLKDPSYATRIEIANALAVHNEINEALPALTDAVNHENLIVVTHAARTIELLGEKAAVAKPAMKKALARAIKIRPSETPATVVLPGDKDLAMFVAFSCHAFSAIFEN